MSAASRARRSYRHAGEREARSVREAFEYLTSDHVHGNEWVAAAADKLWGDMTPAQRDSRKRRDVRAFESAVARQAEADEAAEA